MRKVWLKRQKKISEAFGCTTLVKGGHQINDANDLLYRNDSFTWFKGKRINNSNTHGTGCTLSSAIASNLEMRFVKGVFSLEIQLFFRIILQR